MSTFGRAERRRQARLPPGLCPRHGDFPLVCAVCGLQAALHGPWPTTASQEARIVALLSGQMDAAGWGSGTDMDTGYAVAICPACEKTDLDGYLYHEPPIYPLCISPH